MTLNEIACDLSQSFFCCSCRFYDRKYPLYTMPRCLPPSSMSEAVVTNSIIGDGCILDVICKTLFQILKALAAIVDQKL